MAVEQDSKVARATKELRSRFNLLPPQPTAGAGRGRALEGTELWPFDVELGSAGSAGELYIAVPAGRTA